MRSEKDCEPSERFLIFSATVTSEFYLSELKERINIEEARAFRNRIEAKNEIAVYSLYAYAEITIPKKFDIIFERENPNNFIETEIEVTNVLLSLAGFHIFEEIVHGHKHVCILKFKNEIPKILNLVNDISKCIKEGSFKSAKELCMCQKVDFESIRHYLKSEFNENTEGGAKNL
jgi:hypothetical protein